MRRELLVYCMNGEQMHLLTTVGPRAIAVRKAAWSSRVALVITLLIVVVYVESTPRVYAGTSDRRNTHTLEISAITG